LIVSISASFGQAKIWLSSMLNGFLARQVQNEKSITKQVLCIMIIAESRRLGNPFTFELNDEVN
jgi:hypothetical protein